MKLKIFLLGLFFSVQSFSSENSILNFYNNTDEPTLSYAIFLQSINKYSCLSSLSNSKIASFTENTYRATCSEKARENGKELKDANGRPLYYTTCEFYVYASPKCTGNKIGTISLDRGPRSSKYVNETAIKNSQFSVRIRNDEEYDINNNKVTKGYVLLPTKNAEQSDISVQNTIYYMINNKSKSFLTIGINSPCEALKIGNIDMPPLPPGNSIWSIPNFWLYDKCKSSRTCPIYIYEVSNGICGNLIGAIDIDLEHKNDEWISLYDSNYQLSLQPYLRTSFNARRAITITDKINNIMPNSH